ncbi:MAG TPA: hypothetical protein VFK09_08695 [Gemmatimonadales bacterium]|nr:hypothetical protein [Gemmatimonadales bacterium]
MPQILRPLAAALAAAWALGAAACNRAEPAPAATSSHAAGHDVAAARAPAAAPPLYDNLGTLHHAVTASAEAQSYFDQGLRLVYAFNHDEAIASFKEGARRDPGCAMCWWGVALALGPNINLPMDTSAVAPAMDAVRRAQSLADRVSPAEREYIEAVARRYSDAKDPDRAPLDSAYANAMRDVARAHPDDPDAQALYAESLMDLQPWSYYTAGGKPKGRIGEITSTLEATIAKHPDHPGACHYYIHAVEASLQPERALRCAERLAELMPGAGHLVHMPAHIYMRLGRYADAARHNEHALAADHALIERRHPAGLYPVMYPTHNQHFLWAAYTMMGRSADAIAAAEKVGSALPVEVYKQFPFVQFLAPTPYFALARFGKWDELLRAPAPDPSPELRYVTGMWRYTRGLALAATGKLPAAKAELDSVRAVAAATPADFGIGLNSAKALLHIAERHLAAEVALGGGRRADAVKLLREGVRMEDDLTYDEPPAWYYPLREVLGGVLLDGGDPKAAEAVYREDLLRHRENGWALGGLARSLEAQGRTKEAGEVKERLRKAWGSADVALAN